MQRPFAGVPSDVVEKAREVESVVPVEGRIQVAGARATGVSFLFFSFFFFFVSPAEFVSIMYEKEKGIVAQWAERPKDCVDGESVDGDGNTVVRKKRT